MKSKPILIVGAHGILGNALLNCNRRNLICETQERGSWSTKHLRNNIDTVIYLRALSSPTEVLLAPEKAQQYNVELTQDFISKCLDYDKRVIFASSDVVYGNTGDSFATEESPTSAYGLYAEQKLEIEKSFSGNPKFLALRLSMLVGHGSKLRRILEVEKYPKIPHPIIRNPVNVRYAVQLITKLLKLESWPTDTKVLNVGGRRSISIIELAEIESYRLGLNKPIPCERTQIDIAARPQCVRMNSAVAEELTETVFEIY